MRVVVVGRGKTRQGVKMGYKALVCQDNIQSLFFRWLLFRWLYLKEKRCIYKFIALYFYINLHFDLKKKLQTIFI